jgi:hypothetical protein
VPAPFATITGLIGKVAHGERMIGLPQKLIIEQWYSQCSLQTSCRIPTVAMIAQSSHYAYLLSLDIKPVMPEKDARAP